MRLGLPFAMFVAALTENQSGIILACLVFAVVLLIIDLIKILHRLTNLEDVVGNSTEKIQELHAAIETISDSLKDESG